MAALSPSSGASSMASVLVNNVDLSAASPSSGQWTALPDVVPALASAASGGGSALTKRDFTKRMSMRAFFANMTDGSAALDSWEMVLSCVSGEDGAEMFKQRAQDVVFLGHADG